jgi:Type II restriction endonuclease EcoO109I
VDAKLRLEIETFVRDNIVEFHRWRASNLNRIKLADLIGKKNPYLFRAKNLNVAGDLINAVLTARLSSAEEGVFGKFMEDVAIMVAEKTGRGQKSKGEGIDIELVLDGVRHLIAVKSGKNWGNAQSVAKQKQDFRRAVQVMKQSKLAGEVLPVLGICYGNFRTRHTGEFLHIGGQSFWHLLSGDTNLYVEIIEPLGHEAQRYDDEFKQHVANVTNRLTHEFTEQFCQPNGAIDWPKLVAAVSGNMQPE